MSEPGDAASRAGAPVQPARRLTKGARSSARFRRAAQEVFARQGYLHTKVEDIAKEAGLSPASFYNYYDSKADVLAALAREFHEDASRDIAVPYQSGRPHEEAVREAITIFWSTYKDRLGALSGVFQASMVDDAFLAQWRLVRAEALRFISSGIAAAQREGYCPGMDREYTASALSSMLEHYCYVWLYQGGDAQDAVCDERRAIDALVSIWYRAIYWRP
jgi:AcrR family transcriptional regulator